MKVFGYNPRKFAICSTLPNFKNIVICQLGGPCTLPLIRFSMQYPVVYVFRACAPRKIGNMIVYFVPVQMATFLPLRSRADVSAEHQCVDRNPSITASTTKIDIFIAMRIDMGNEEAGFFPWQVVVCSSTSTANGENSPVLCDTISRKTGDLAEFAGNVRIDIRHGLAPFSRVFVEKPVRGSQDRTGFVFA